MAVHYPSLPRLQDAMRRCPIAAFHSIVEACEEHEVDAEAFWPKILDASKVAA